MADDVREALEKARIEDEFWARHYQKFLKLYPDKFVAVYNDDVVAVDDDLLELVRKIKAKGHLPPDVKIQFIASDPQFLLV